MDLRVLIDPKLDLERLSRDLDELGHSGRVWAIQSWNKRLQAKLFEGAKGFRALTLADFVPASVPPLTTVIHEGLNTLPVQRHFQKRFCRPAPEATENSPLLYGYNHQALTPLTGPGYFVARPSEPGEVALDYTLVPRQAPQTPQTPTGWPQIIPNSAKLGRFVYDGMIDIMRGISAHVTIGRAQKVRPGRPSSDSARTQDPSSDSARTQDSSSEAQWMDAYFVLVRHDNH